MVFIAVGTPSRRGDGHADLSYVYAAAASIADALDGFTVVVTKSTVPVGTGDEVERIIRATNPKADFAVASNPEFLREGAAIEDFKRPDRIVIGIEDERARDVMAEVYRPLYLNQAPIQFTERRTAELIKYSANAFLAMKITFINEIADLCESAGGNVQDVARGIGLDNRIGTKFLNAGPGYGGSCFPKDTLALVKIAHDHGTPLRLVETTVAINDQRKRAMGRKVVVACGGNVRGKTIGILGLTFEPQYRRHARGPLDRHHPGVARCWYRTVFAMTPKIWRGKRGIWRRYLRHRHLRDRRGRRLPRAGYGMECLPFAPLRSPKDIDEGARSGGRCATSIVNAKWKRMASPTTAWDGRRSRRSGKAVYTTCMVMTPMRTGKAVALVLTLHTCGVLAQILTPATDRLTVAKLFLRPGT